MDELVKELQQADIVGLDETPWYENGCLKWLWVAISKFTAVFHVGTRKKEELLNLILVGFTRWLVTDGYIGYRDRERRQRCLAHLIRKAIALAGATDKASARMGDWLLRELRGLIKAMAEGSRAYAALLSVIETCRLRNQDPWSYIAKTITLARKGIAPLPIPQPAVV